MNALSEIYCHGQQMSSTLIFVEAAYSLAAQSNNSFMLEPNDPGLREIRLRRGLAAEQDLLEALRRHNRIAFDAIQLLEFIKAIQADRKEQEVNFENIEHKLSNSNQGCSKQAECSI